MVCISKSRNVNLPNLGFDDKVFSNKKTSWRFKKHSAFTHKMGSYQLINGVILTPLNGRN